MIGTAPVFSGIKILGVIAGFVACVAAIYIVSGQKGNPEIAAPGVPEAVIEEKGTQINKITRAMATGAMTAFVIKAERKPVPDLLFQDAQGKQRSLSQWRGQVVLLNLWATWCGPCRSEMPSLATLQRRFGSNDFEVVAVSVDKGGAKVAAPFLQDTKASELRLYVDPTGKSIEMLTALGLPATVLIDREGKEIGRLLGPADWTSAEAYRLVNLAINEGQPGS
jgi:thiol-disulfide isomerase/thioredoxin